MFDLVRERERPDGVEIVHYEPRFPPGSRARRRVVRSIAALFLLAGAAAIAAVVAYLGSGSTPVLGAALALALLASGSALVVWAKQLLPAEVAVERWRVEADRPGGSAVRRRPLLKGAVVLGLATAAAAPLAGSLVRDPHAPVDGRVGLSPSDHTGWHPALNGGQPVRLVDQRGRPVRPADVSVGGLVTVFPGIPAGTGNRYADSPTLLIRLRQEQAAELRANLYPLNRDSMAGDFVAYSKICTHVGCPTSLFERQTGRLLCPCHQSQFLVTDNARPVFGPATRSLAMLPIALDGDGYFVAVSDYRVPVGPSYWER